MKRALLCCFAAIAVNLSAQLSTATELERNAYRTWILLADENGCLENYPCNDIIRINDTPQPYSIGTKWTYEAVNIPVAQTKPQVYEIIDTVQWQGENAFFLDPQFVSGPCYMLKEGNRVYFWDEELQDYQLNYDFGNDSLYTIAYKSPGAAEPDSVVVYVDSIRNVLLNGVEHEVQFCRSTLGVGTIENFFEVIESVGTSYGDLRLPIGFVNDNITNNIRQIRCFDNNIVSYQFVPYPCDSTWITTAVMDPQQRHDIVVYPNPTSGLVHINGIDAEVNYKLYTIDGAEIASGRTRNRSLPVHRAGVSILMLEVDGFWVVKRVVRLE